MAGLIETRRDRKRGCGWRKPGGLYLVCDGLPSACGKLPIPLTVCPTCHHGIHPSRSWTWIDADALTASAPCSAVLGATAVPDCAGCVLARPMGRAGLLWVGGAFYPTPEAWVQEARKQGVSRRIPAVPRGFELGKTWVLVAHREAIPIGHDKFIAGVFHVFKPTAVEFVVRGNETVEELEALRKRGITPIRIERVDDAPEQPALTNSPQFALEGGLS